MNEGMLRLKDISLSFGTNEIFANMEYTFKPGIYVFSGPSGVGKTTLMRMIAGLETRYSGEIYLDETNMVKIENGIEIKRSSTLIKKPIPQIHMVHQHYKSFPWLSCVDNVLMVHKGHKVRPTTDDVRQAMEVLERLGISEHAQKWPTQISGGQDQRLSLASAFVNRWSPVILYDEPTSALDEANDMLVVELIKEHQARFNTIEIVITHEQHVIDGLDPIIVEFSPEFRLRPKALSIVDKFLEDGGPKKDLLLTDWNKRFVDLKVNESGDKEEAKGEEEQTSV